MFPDGFTPPEIWQRLAVIGVLEKCADRSHDNFIWGALTHREKGEETNEVGMREEVTRNRWRGEERGQDVVKSGEKRASLHQGGREAINQSHLEEKKTDEANEEQTASRPSSNAPLGQRWAN